MAIELSTFIRDTLIGIAAGAKDAGRELGEKRAKSTRIFDRGIPLTLLLLLQLNL